jgi:hypothetical protein
MLLRTKKQQHHFVGMLETIVEGSGVGEYVMRFFPCSDNVRCNVYEALVYEGLSDETVLAISTFLQMCNILTPTGFNQLIKNDAVLPYLAVFAGFIGKGDNLLKLLTPEPTQRYKLRHLIVLGILTKRDQSGTLPDWAHTDDELLQSLVDYFVAKKKYHLLHMFERMVLLDRTKLSFRVHLLVSMTLLDGYKKVLSSTTVENPELWFKVLQVLFERNVKPMYMWKFQCMINFPIRSARFRMEFYDTLRANGY